MGKFVRFRVDFASIPRNFEDILGTVTAKIAFYGNYFQVRNLGKYITRIGTVRTSSNNLLCELQDLFDLVGALSFLWEYP